MIKHEAVIEDEENGDGREVCRWRCTGCGRHGHWTPERERALVAIRGEAHVKRFRKKRPTKAQQAARRTAQQGQGRTAGADEFGALRNVLRFG